MSDETAAALRALERQMRRRGLRGHVYVVDAETVIGFATSRGRPDEKRAGNLGPGPIEEAWAAIEAAGSRRPSATELYGSNHEEGKVPPVAWNSPALVVTGVQATHALLVAAEHPQEQPAETLRRLHQLAGWPTTETIDSLHEATMHERLRTMTALEEALDANG